MATSRAAGCSFSSIVSKPLRVSPKLQETESSTGCADHRPRKPLPSRVQIPSSDLSSGCGGAPHPSPPKMRRAHARSRCEVLELQLFIAPFLDITAHFPNYICLVPT